MAGIAQFSGFFGRSLIAVAAASMLTLAPVAFQTFALSIADAVPTNDHSYPRRKRFSYKWTDHCTVRSFAGSGYEVAGYRMDCIDPPPPEGLCLCLITEYPFDPRTTSPTVRELLRDYERNEFAPSLEKDWNDTLKIGQPKLAFLPPTT